MPARLVYYKINALKKYFEEGGLTMLTILTRWLLASILLSGFLSTTHAATADPGPQRWVPGQILVEPRAGTGESDFEAVLGTHGAHDKGRIGPLNVHIVSVPPQAEAAVANALSHNPQNQICRA